jgi:hypothetical protein
MNDTQRRGKKIGLMVCAVFLGTLTGLTARAADIVVEAPGVSIHATSDFYEPLGTYGRWESVGEYGRCWIPGQVDAGWSPYCNGSWVQSDAGWFWASAEPWGWATYHYGRWDSNAQFGWYWVPQTQWAPAWVSWREGGGYIGWAPLNPAGRPVVGVSEKGGAVRGFAFVNEAQFLDPISPRSLIVENAAITKAVSVRKTPNAAIIAKATGRQVKAVPVGELRSKDEAQAVAKRPAPAATSEKAVVPPVRTQAEKPAEPAKSEVRPVDQDKRADQEKAQPMEDAKVRATAPAEVKPPEKMETKPAAERPAAAKESAEPKADEKKE